MELIESLPSQKKSINIKKEIGKYLRNWYWILLSMLVFYIGAKVYLRYLEPQYLSKTTLKFAETKGKANSSTLSDLQTLGNGLSGNNELQSETSAIIAKPLLAKVVDNLGLNISFYGLGKIKEPELYTSTPLVGKLLSVSADNFSTVNYLISPNGSNGFVLSEGPLLKGKSSFKFGEIVELPFGKIILNKKDSSSRFNAMKIRISSTKRLVSWLEGAVQVNLPENKGLLMDLSLKGTVPAKSEDILNAITKQYTVDEVTDRNAEAQNTQDFINDRLVIITDDLSGIESQKENFKKANQITDLDAQANIALTNSTQNIKDVVAVTTKLDLVNSIFSATSGDKLLPSNMGLSGVTEGYISKYNELVLQRNKSLKQATNANPAIIELNREIGEVKNLVRQNLIETREALQIQLGQLQGQINLDKSKISNYPTQEKVFRSIERQQNLKEQLYLYLLQKREENAITLSVTAPKSKVLNPAYTTGIVYPDYQQITLGALLIGLLLPVVFLYAKFTLDTKVHTKEDITKTISNASVLSEIPFVDEQNTMVEPNDFSVFAESFRILTSNLKYILKAKTGNVKSHVVLITSSVKGEGKTTIAMNTAITLAGSAKVLLVGADIRNPQIQRFIPGTKKGLTDYLISEDTSVDSFIVNSKLSPNLDILFSGAVAPNPNDLLDMPKFDEMIEELKSKYKYIILDSAPVMLVSDTLHLIENSDAILYVVKSDFTENEMLDFAKEFRLNNQIDTMSFILNNVKPENKRYGSKYGYGYYTEENDQNFLVKKFNSFFGK